MKGGTGAPYFLTNTFQVRTALEKVMSSLLDLHHTGNSLCRPHLSFSGAYWDHNVLFWDGILWSVPFWLGCVSNLFGGSSHHFFFFHCSLKLSLWAVYPLEHHHCFSRGLNVCCYPEVISAWCFSGSSLIGPATPSESVSITCIRTCISLSQSNAV